MKTIYSLQDKLGHYFRSKRWRAFFETFEINSKTRILDIGGYSWIWSQMSNLKCEVTIVNIHNPEAQYRWATEKIHVIEGDGTNLTFADKSFDIIYCNSVIEHLGASRKPGDQGPTSAQTAMAREIHRVGKNYWVQTPAMEFPIEPHFLSPLVHWLPEKWQYPWVRLFSLWGILTRPSKKQIYDLIREVRLLRYQEFVALFPHAAVKKEKLLALPKSYIAIRKEKTQE